MKGCLQSRTSCAFQPHQASGALSASLMHNAAKGTSVAGTIEHTLSVAAGSPALPAAAVDSGGANPARNPVAGPQAHPIAGHSADTNSSGLSVASPSAPSAGGAGGGANPGGGASGVPGASGSGVAGGGGSGGSPGNPGVNPSGGARPVGGANGGHLGGGVRSALLRTLVSVPLTP